METIYSTDKKVSIIEMTCDEYRVLCCAIDVVRKRKLEAADEKLPIFSATFALTPEECAVLDNIKL